MKIGWDLDGCLGAQDNVAVCTTRDNPEVKELYYATMLPQAHPEFYAAQSDEVFIITGRQESLRAITEQWCAKWFPQYKLIIAPTEPWTDASQWSAWFRRVAENKAEMINALELDVYFEDMPETVMALRELCPSTKIIQFGGRLK